MIEQLNQQVARNAGSGTFTPVPTGTGDGGPAPLPAPPTGRSAVIGRAGKFPNLAEHADAGRRAASRTGARTNAAGGRPPSIQCRSQRHGREARTAEHARTRSAQSSMHPRAATACPTPPPSDASVERRPRTAAAPVISDYPVMPGGQRPFSTRPRAEQPVGSEPVVSERAVRSSACGRERDVAGRRSLSADRLGARCRDVGEGAAAMDARRVVRRRARRRTAADARDREDFLVARSRHRALHQLDAWSMSSSSPEPLRESGERSRGSMRAAARRLRSSRRAARAGADRRRARRLGRERRAHDAVRHHDQTQLRGRDARIEEELGPIDVWIDAPTDAGRTSRRAARDCDRRGASSGCGARRAGAALASRTLSGACTGG